MGLPQLVAIVVGSIAAAAGLCWWAVSIAIRVVRKDAPRRPTGHPRA